jgi:hypothetical protein
MNNLEIAKFYGEERLFWVTDSNTDNEEIFTCKGDALEYLQATKMGANPRLRICIVRNAYQDTNNEWTYEDTAGTFTTVQEVTL